MTEIDTGHSSLVSPPPPKNPKVQAVMDAATACFLEHGYEGTTIDDIASRAGVSKPTVYRHFQGKQTLYERFIRLQCALHGEQIFALEFTGTDILADLVKIGRSYIDLIFSRPAIAMFRVSLSEINRFPELGRAFYDAGPSAGTRRMSQFLAGAVARGLLRIDDVDAAAEEFSQLCKAGYFYKLQFGIIPEVHDADKTRLADRTARTFLRAYAVPDGSAIG